MPCHVRAAVLLGILSLISTAQAQTTRPAEDARDVVRLNQTRLGTAPISTPLRTSPLGPASITGAEFGDQEIVHRTAHVEPWSATAGTDLFYTDNVALAPINRQEDWYLRSGAAVGYTNRIRGPFFVDFSLQQYFFRYREFDLLDFDLTRFEGALLMQTPWGTDAFFFFRYRLERLTEAGFGTPLLTQHVGEVGLQKVWKISRGQQIFAGATADFALNTDPEAASRNEYALSLGYSLRLTEKLTGALSYRGSFYDYNQTPREDWNQILAAGFTYDVTNWMRLGLNFSYNKNNSNFATADYQNIVPGASLALRVTF